MHMTTAKTITIWCDAPGCQSWSYGTTQATTPTQLRRELKPEGWRRIGERDICPNHRDEMDDDGKLLVRISVW